MEDGNESYMPLSGDYSGIPVMEYLVMANADRLCLFKTKKGYRLVGVKW